MLAVDIFLTACVSCSTGLEYSFVHSQIQAINMMNNTMLLLELSFKYQLVAV